MLSFLLQNVIKAALLESLFLAKLKSSNLCPSLSLKAIFDWPINSARSGTTVIMMTITMTMMTTTMMMMMMKKHLYLA